MRSTIDLLNLTCLVLGMISSVTLGLQCHCNFVDSSCINNVCNAGFGSCQAFYQEGQFRQACNQLFISAGECMDSKFSHTPGSVVEFFYCCTGNLCNSVEDLHNEILKRNLSLPTTPPPSTTTTYSSSGSTTISMSTTTTTTTTFSRPSYPSTTTTYFSSSSTKSQCSGSLCAVTTIQSSLESSSVRIGPTLANSRSGSLPTYSIAVIAVLAVMLVVFILVIFIVIFLHYYPRHVIGAMSVESDGTPTCTLSTECGDLDENMFREGFEGTTSGSGAGLPLLVQRSVAAQVTLKEVIGKGRFGEVRRGVYKGDEVAVKIFHTKEESSWNHEVEIYQTCLLRHPNILRFIAADNKDIGISTQLWLITEYCDNGSLYDVLQDAPLSEDKVLKLCFTAASGLAHLHSDIIGTEGKPAIAHRDIKTRNILVKSDFSCCLADLGLSLRYYRETDKVEEPPTKKVGTRRYLSPEILNDSMNISNFDSFKRSDMYSFGLVMWETARRGICSDTYEQYQLPYFDLVCPDPTFEDMKKVVAIEKKRPTIPNRWSQSEVFHGLAQIMEQCWHHDGEARLTALRVKKNLSNLQSMNKCKGKKSSIHSET